MTRCQRNGGIVGFALLTAIGFACVVAGGGARSAALYGLAFYGACVVVLEQTGIRTEHGVWRAAKVSATGGAVGTALALGRGTASGLGIVIAAGIVLLAVIGLVKSVGHAE